MGSFTGEFYQKFKEEIIIILHNLSQKTEAEGKLNLFRQKHYDKIKLQTSITHDIEANFLNKILQNQIQINITHHDQVAVFSGIQIWFNI
jgi:hypothetical protein